MSQLCFPYSTGITCVCDAANRIFRCFPELSKKADNAVEKASPALYKKFCDFLAIFNGSTETILSVACLLIIVFAFLAFLIYRCERILLKNRRFYEKRCCTVDKLLQKEASSQTVAEASANPIYAAPFHFPQTTLKDPADRLLSASQSADYLLEDTSLDKLQLLETRSYDGHIV